MAQPKDRREQLLASSTLNGIDFVEIMSADQKTLRVHFLNAVVVEGTIRAGFPTITGGETVPNVTVNPINDATDWAVDAEGRRMLTLTVPAAGDFSFYTLTIKSTALDQFYEAVSFSFKALCPSELDCEPEPPECPPVGGDMPPIDYLAKDFLSFRKALSDFSALRYPEWQERSEADFGVMFMEALCSLADDLSYTQDRIAAEASLETATERRSIVRHARLFDYEPRPATGARVLLQFDVPVTNGTLAPGLLVIAQGADNVPVHFETGKGLADQTSYAVRHVWNKGIQPYFWDDSRRCLEAGTTSMWVLGHGFDFRAGQMLLIDTEALTPADPHVREIVRLVEDGREKFDPLYGENVTYISWGEEDALKFNHDISLDAHNHSRTSLAGNLIPATQGRRFTESFAIETAPASSPVMPVAVTRYGPNSVPPNRIIPQYQYTLRNGALTWLADEDPEEAALPEIRLLQVDTGGTPQEWQWYRMLLDADSFDSGFTVDAARFSRTARLADGEYMQDYDGDDAQTIRFGDGVFGALPPAGAVFTITYRVGAGAAGNVAADAITKVDPSSAMAGWLVTNPFPAEGGADEESDERVRRLAPQKFRAKQFRAVRPEDYEAAAQTLPWVFNAGTKFRWTGSWLTVFTTVDPKGTEEFSVKNHIELINLLNRYRLAGYESYTPLPRFTSLDLVVTVCARRDAFRGDVAEAILSVLSAKTFIDKSTGFFHPDRFTFGTPLERSRLEAAIQSAYGVAGVVSITYRRRGVIQSYLEMGETVEVADDEILRVSNDPSRPERGSLKVIVEGGK